MHIMIETQIIKENNKPVAVIIDYQEYLKFQALKDDLLDYREAVEIKENNKKWISHDNLTKELGT